MARADGVPRPRADLEPVLDDVVGAKRVRGRRRRVVELTRLRVDLHLREAETAHAWPRQAYVQSKVEDRRARRLRDLHVDGKRLGVRLVALAAEQERIELDLDSFFADFPRTGAPVVEGRWSSSRRSVALRGRTRVTERCH